MGGGNNPAPSPLHQQSWRGFALFLDCFAAEAVGAVVVDDAAGLHPGIDDDRADELETAFLECCRDLFGERSLRWIGPMVLNLLIASHLPYPGGEVFPGVGHGDVDMRTVDSRFDLGAGADDAFVLKKPGYIGFAHAGDFFGIKVAEGFSEGLALTQDSKPGESGLEAVEHE